MNLAEGTPFNPWRIFKGAWIPESLLKNKGVSSGAAICYGLLGRYAGQGGKAWPRQGTLASDMAVTERTVQRRIQELVGLKLIKVEPKAKGRQGTVNAYTFLWKSMLITGQMPLVEATQMSPLNTTLLSSSTPRHLIAEESQGKRTSKPSSPGPYNPVVEPAVENSCERSDEKVHTVVRASGSESVTLGIPPGTPIKIPDALKLGHKDAPAASRSPDPPGKRLEPPRGPDFEIEIACLAKAKAVGCGSP